MVKGNIFFPCDDGMTAMMSIPSAFGRKQQQENKKASIFSHLRLPMLEGWLDVTFTE
jgi:hypothetical protein